MFVVAQLVVIDVYNHRFHKVFMASESVTHITERDDIYVYAAQSIISATSALICLL